VSDRLREVLGEAGITVPAFASFNESEEAKVVRIAPGSILTAARAMIAQSEIDALFVSCTNLRALDVIAPFEAETSVPLLRLAKLDAAPEGAGMLWRA
jgi:maleate isomerase